jgi:hypothetical protein
MYIDIKSIKCQKTSVLEGGMYVEYKERSSKSYLYGIKVISHHISSNPFGSRLLDHGVESYLIGLIA